MDKVIQHWPLSRLKPHPRQQEIFRDLDGPAFDDLVEDMRLRGQDNPIESLPDGTIICGHQRWRAAQKLGWEEIDVWVREDLAQEPDAAIEQHLISDNLHRRHLDKLELGRCYQQLCYLERELPHEKRHSYASGDLRDMIGRKLGASGRNLDRYLKVLKTPKEVQDAFSQGKLSLVEAGKVAGLSGESQAAIQAAIRSGKKAKEVVQEALKRKASGRQKQRQLRNQARLLLRTLTSLEETANSPDGLDTEVIELLECAKTRLNALLADSEARGS